MVSTLEMLISIGRQLHDLPDVYDLLESIHEIIRAEPGTRRAHVLTAILHCLVSDREAFSESHVYALGQMCGTRRAPHATCSCASSLTWCCKLDTPADIGER
jgi:hypothetical protein